MSVSCGIPDFRSRDGIYARLAVDFPDLPDPQAMFDIEYFRRDPRPFFKFAKVCLGHQLTSVHPNGLVLVFPVSPKVMNASLFTGNIPRSVPAFALSQIHIYAGQARKAAAQLHTKH